MVKNPPASAEDLGLTPGFRRSPGKGNGNPLQYSCLGNPMDCSPPGSSGGGEEPGGLQSMGSQKELDTT